MFNAHLGKQLLAPNLLCEILSKFTLRLDFGVTNSHALALILVAHVIKNPSKNVPTEVY